MAENRKPKKVRVRYGDGSIVQRDDGSWKGYVTFGGVKKWFSATTVQEAEALHRDLLVARDKGLPATPGKLPTVAEWVRQHIEFMTNLDEDDGGWTPHTTRGNIANAVNIERDPIGSIKLNKLTIADVESFYARMRERGLSGSTRYKHHNLLRVAMKEAVHRDLIHRNVLLMVRVPSAKAKVVRPKTFTDAELGRVIAAAIGDRYEARWLLAVTFGLRPGEIAGLQWQNVDLVNRKIHVVEQLHEINHVGTVIRPRPKTEKGDRVLTIPQSIVDSLIRNREAQLAEMLAYGDGWGWEFEGRPIAFVFTQPNGYPMKNKYDSSRWFRLLDAALVDTTRRYTARHTAASNAIAKGIDPAVVSKMLGHANISFTMDTYVHAVDERMDAFADSIELSLQNHAAEQEKAERMRALGL